MPTSGLNAVSTIKSLSDAHEKPVDIRFQYGTAGFRTLGSVLDSVMFRVGIIAGLRSKKLDGRTIGVMVTASHNPEPDNGVKLVDPKGEMLEASWESYATTLANVSDSDEVIKTIESIVETAKIDLSKPARVVYARDTRPSGPALVSALEDGFKAIGAESRDAGVTTTPVLHYLVRAINTKGTQYSYGEDSEEGYFSKLGSAFKKLVAGRPAASSLIIDCANGVGAPAANKLSQYLGDTLPIILENTAIKTNGALNNACGADYVKTSQKLPPSLANRLQPGQRACSLDGDADRLIYYYLDDRGIFHMLDGDKIAALVAAFIVELVKLAGLEGQINVGVIQTAYANGASTKYLSERFKLPVKCVPTGVKHLHHAAERYDVGVYFEANGHGTVLFSQPTIEAFAQHQPSTPAQSKALEHLISLTELINQTVGDALSDMLLVEVVLSHKSYSGIEWDSLYVDLPNRLVKVVVADRNAYKTEDAERRLVSPEGLQQKIEGLMNRYQSGRSFVRPSGTEDVVRVYAEAAIKSQADELAFRVAGLVYDEAGGDPASRPKEFL
ncbi:phosphoacetylglucosamine mutase [Marasmius fiardii PR-910]|nr:phosphoacetylglucosamine mutase [Marasmius fiardii PR-910]